MQQKRVHKFLVVVTAAVLTSCMLSACVEQSSLHGQVPPISADDLHIVDCLLPGQIRKLGSRMTYLSPRRPIQTSAQDCEIYGGEYVAYDRATSGAALRIWQPLAEQGDADAQNKVGEIYERGIGGEPDYVLAAAWYRKAAEQGLARAQINLGFLLEKGLGSEKNLKTALSWYRKASKLPDAVLIEKTDLDAQKAQIASLRQDLNHSHAQLDQARMELLKREQQLQRERQKLKKRLHNKGTINLSDADKRLLDANHRKLEQQHKELIQRQKRIQELESHSQQQQERLLLLETEDESLREQLKLVRIQAQRAQQDLISYQTQATDSERQLAQARTDLSALADENQHATEIQLAELKSHLQEREQALAHQQEMVKRLQAESDQWRLKLEQLEQKRATGTARTADAKVPTAPPSIQLIEPPLVATRGGEQKRIPVKRGLTEQPLIGRVTTSEGLYALTVNGVRTQPDAKGLFETAVPVTDNNTPVNIVAIDKQGKRAALAFSLVSQEDSKTMVAKRVNPIAGIEVGKFHALVIGNQAYQHLPKLDTSGADANAVAEILDKSFGYRVKLLRDASRYDILSELNRMRKELTDKDNLLIYYAGHGELDRVNLRGHWLPVDAELQSTANWISNVAITDILNAMSVRHVLVVADSCYSGALTRSSLSQLESGQSSDARRHWFTTISKMRSRTALTSGALAPVLDGGGGKHSVFANAFLGVLQDLDEVAEGQRIYREVSARVAYEANKYQVEQVPQYAPIKYSGHEAGDYMFIPNTFIKGQG